MNFPRIESSGLNSLCMTFADVVSAEVLGRICALRNSLLREQPVWLIDCVPAYVSLTVYFDNHCTDRFAVKHVLLAMLEKSSLEVSVKGQLHRIPVWYSGRVCPDLAAISRHLGMSESAIVDLHCQSNYRVYAVGFAPNFGYLGELPELLRMPRLESPRLNIPAGSVAVAENQTAVYPANSPAGWHVLGLCPLPLTGSNKAINFSVGDEVVFEPIDEARFIALGGDVVAVEEIAWPH